MQLFSSNRRPFRHASCRLAEPRASSVFASKQMNTSCKVPRHLQDLQGGFHCLCDIPNAIQRLAVLHFGNETLDKHRQTTDELLTITLNQMYIDMYTKSNEKRATCQSIQIAPNKEPTRAQNARRFIAQWIRGFFLHFEELWTTPPLTDKEVNASLALLMKAQFYRDSFQLRYWESDGNTNARMQVEEVMRHLGTRPGSGPGESLIDTHLRYMYRTDYIVACARLQRPFGQSCHAFHFYDWQQEKIMTGTPTTTTTVEGEVLRYDVQRLQKHISELGIYPPEYRSIYVTDSDRRRFAGRCGIYLAAYLLETGIRDWEAFSARISPVLTSLHGTTALI